MKRQVSLTTSLNGCFGDMRVYSLKMKVICGKVHKYLSMTLDFMSKSVVKVSMCKYVGKIVEARDAACLEFDGVYTVVTHWKRIHMAAPDDLFKADDNAIKLGPAEA
jgi:hypothetical protein